MKRPRGTYVLSLAAAALLALTAARVFNPGARPFANAADPAMTTRGAHVYWRQCGPCHGDHLQGQPFWQLVDQDAGRRAPALDATGRAWRRSDAELFQVVKYGRYPDRVYARESQMPAYEGALEDPDILAVLAFVKARWPVGERALQASRNPNQEGMPAEARTSDWRLPATCFPHDAVAVVERRL